jgi:hypothetical protein
MAPRVISNIGGKTVEILTGDEVIQVESGSQVIKLIRVKDFQRYLGGDVEVPTLRLERGAHPVKISDFPNAETVMTEKDIITGIQDTPLMDTVRELVAEEVAKALKK